MSELGSTASSGLAGSGWPVSCVACVSSHDDIETAPGKDIGEVAAVVKPGQVSFTGQSPASLSQ